MADAHDRGSVPGPDVEMSPQAAIARMAAVTSNVHSLRVRTEGLTLVVWALCMAASYLTIALPFVGGGAPHHDPDGAFNASIHETYRPGEPRFEGGTAPLTVFFASRLAPLLWFAVATVVTVAIWRSAALDFQTRVTTPRVLAVAVSWLAILMITTVIITYVEGGRPRGWHLAGWSVVFGLFSLLNPLHFTDRGRVAAGVVAGVVLAGAAYAYVAGLGARDASFASGLFLGVPGLAAGLWLMYRG